jgi:hypothetical protein
LTSPEVVAARAVAVVMLERVVRARTAPLLWGAAGVAAILVVGAVLSDGIGAVIVGLFALVAAVVALTMFFVRRVVLRVMGRVAGGREFARARPIVERHIDEVERARGALPTDAFAVARLLWMARHPSALGAHVRDVATTLARSYPSVVTEVRREL